MMQKIRIIAAITFALIALAGFLVLAQPTTRKTATGVITSKTFKPDSTHTQTHGGRRRSSTQIPIAEAYSFEIKVDEMDEPARISLNTLASKNFEIGQQVRIEYDWRRIPFIFRRVTVVDMKPAE
jgi:hypothetical protein